jgi:hypothetical protein
MVECLGFKVKGLEFYPSSHVGHSVINVEWHRTGLPRTAQAEGTGPVRVAHRRRAPARALVAHEGGAAPIRAEREGREGEQTELHPHFEEGKGV